MNMIPAEYRLLASIILVVVILSATAGLSSWATYRYEENKWYSAVAAQKIDAALLMVQEVEKVRNKERTAASLNNQLEKRHAKDLETRNAQLDAALRSSRLRDPGRGGGGSCTETPTAGSPVSGDRSTSGAELSGEATDFLRKLTNQCDRVVDQFLTCQAYAVGLYSICSQ